MDSSMKTPEIFFDGHCRTIFMVEVKLDDSKWGETPKIFHNKEEAEKEIEALRLKYSLFREYRVITRKEKDD